MANYTSELWRVLKVTDIFDFIYERTPESINLLSDEDLQQGFIDHFYFREIGFETVERFKFRLKTLWRESLGQFDALLVAYSKPINPMSNTGGTSESTIIDNDTPKNALDFGEQSNHASHITHSKSNSNGYNGMSEIELLEKYHDKIKDIQTEFYEQFECLFMQLN